MRPSFTAAKRRYLCSQSFARCLRGRCYAYCGLLCDTYRMAADPGEGDDRTHLELLKLRAETEKLRREIAKLDQAVPAARAHRLELIKTLAAGIAAVVAITGFFVSFYNQRRDAQRIVEVRRDDEFAGALKQLADAKEELGRVASINAIAVFASDAKYETRVRHLLMQILPVVREQRTRTAISEALALHSTPITLAELVQFNRAIQEQIETRISQRMSEASANVLVRNAEKYDQRLEGDEDYRVLAWPNSWSRSDTKLQALVDDLGWSAETLLTVMNNLHEIQNIDMSGVVLARLEPSGLPKSDPVPTFGDPVRCGPERVPVIGLTLRHVNLSNSVLACVDFKRATFDQVTMDNTTLYRSSFTECAFKNVSLSSFRSWVSLVNDQGIHIVAPVVERSYFAGPVWRECELTISQFGAREPSHEQQKMPHGSYYGFFGSTWQIQKLGGVAPPPRARHKQDFDGRVNS